LDEGRSIRTATNSQESLSPPSPGTPVSSAASVPPNHQTESAVGEEEAVGCDDDDDDDGDKNGVLVVLDISVDAALYSGW
jgi:hypothetical protein